MGLSPRLLRLHQEACRATEKSGGFQHTLALWRAVASQAEVDGTPEAEPAIRARRILAALEEGEAEPN
jgi:hypothetical protein